MCDPVDHIRIKRFIDKYTNHNPITVDEIKNWKKALILEGNGWSPSELEKNEAIARVLRKCRNSVKLSDGVKIGSGSYGVVYLLHPDIVAKQVSRSWMGKYEYEVGLVINELCRHVDNLVYTYGYHDNDLITLQAIRGSTLHSLITKIPNREIIEIVNQIIGTLFVAQRYRFVHNDLHTENIICEKLSETVVHEYSAFGYTFTVSSRWRVKIIDYGMTSIDTVSQHGKHERMFFDVKMDNMCHMNRYHPGVDIFIFLMNMNRITTLPVIEQYFISMGVPGSIVDKWFYQEEVVLLPPSWEIPFSVNPMSWLLYVNAHQKDKPKPWSIGDSHLRVPLLLSNLKPTALTLSESCNKVDDITYEILSKLGLDISSFTETPYPRYAGAGGLDIGPIASYGPPDPGLVNLYRRDLERFEKALLDIERSFKDWTLRASLGINTYKPPPWWYDVWIRYQRAKFYLN